MALLQVVGTENEGELLYRLEKLLHLVALRFSILGLKVQQPNPTRILVEAMTCPTLPCKLESKALRQPAHLFKS
jgi:hypothetical protein